MAGKFSKKPQPGGWVLGGVLILLLLAALFFGARWVLRASKGQEQAEALDEKLPVTAEAAPETPEPEQEVRPEQLPEIPLPEQPVQQSPAEEEPEPARVTLMALGDNLIHNTVYWSAETGDGGYDFSPFYETIAQVAAQYDIACINQETILVENPALYDNYPSFGSPVQVADALAGAGFSVITGATNHCFDKGETGILDTCRYWRENYPEITTLGIHDTEQDAKTLRVVEKNGIRIAMLNYTYGLNGGAPGEAWMVDRLTTFDAAREDLKRAEEAADFVIAFVHWGEEGAFRPNQYQKDWAKVLADGGADLIIGAHPHVVQPVQVQTADDGREVPVFYSLGNFLSHQTEPQNMLGGMASVTICMEGGRAAIEDYALVPTVNLITRNADTGWYLYQPMLLSDYTPELAAQHRFPACTAEYMNQLFESIISGTAG